MRDVIRRLRYPLSFAGIHTALVLLVGLAVWASDDGETGMRWGLFYMADWPVSVLLSRATGEAAVVGGLLLLGGAWWAGIGALAQLVVTVYRSVYRQ